MKKYADLRSER
jgi:hypothetical protein